MPIFVEDVAMAMVRTNRCRFGREAGRHSRFQTGHHFNQKPAGFRLKVSSWVSTVGIKCPAMNEDISMLARLAMRQLR